MNSYGTYNPEISKDAGVVDFLADVAVFPREGETQGGQLFDDIYLFLTKFVTLPSVHAGRAITA